MSHKINFLKNKINFKIKISLKYQQAKKHKSLKNKISLPRFVSHETLPKFTLHETNFIDYLTIKKIQNNIISINKNNIPKYKQLSINLVNQLYNLALVRVTRNIALVCVTRNLPIQVLIKI